MRRWGIVGMAVLCLMLASETKAVDMGVGLRLGTQGLGVEYGIGISQWFGVRGAAYWADISTDYDDSGVEYDGTLLLGGYGVFADFYPAKNGFRLSVGLLSNRNEVELEATPTEDQEIGDNTYTPTELGTVSGGVTFDSTAPYFGIGFGRFSGGDRVGFLFDAGVVHQGSGEVSLVSSTGLIPQDDLDKEIAEIEDDIQDYEYWPVISFGLVIRF